MAEIRGAPAERVGRIAMKKKSDGEPDREGEPESRSVRRHEPNDVEGEERDGDDVEDRKPAEKLFGGRWERHLRLRGREAARHLLGWGRGRWSFTARTAKQNDAFAEAAARRVWVDN